MTRFAAREMVGEAFGNYEVLSALGKGGMGEVFLAQHQRIARRAAIKVLSPDLTRDPAAVKRFFTEARATSLIHHAGIVEVFDCGFDERGRAYIVMEYLEGENLGAYLKRTGPLPWIPACAIARRVAEAVGAAHGSGIVHRDLKPENVFLWAGEPRSPLSSPGTAVKVLDFGIAKLLSIEARAERITRDGIMLGTPHYISPEQWYGAAEVDQRADIYSLGCILYEMICGAPPFTRDRMQALMAAHMFEPPRAPGGLAPAIPAWLDQLILRMLGKEPEERPASMVEVAGLLAAADAGPRRPAQAGPSPGGARARRRTAVMQAASIAVAVGGLAAVLLVLWLPQGARPSGRSDQRRAGEPAHAPAGAVSAAPAAPPGPAVAGGEQGRPGQQRQQVQQDQQGQIDPPSVADAGPAGLAPGAAVAAPPLLAPALPARSVRRRSVQAAPARQTDRPAPRAPAPAPAEMDGIVDL